MLLKDHPDEDPPWWETTPKKDHPNERPPQRKTTPNERPHLMRNHPKKDYPEERPSQWKTMLLRDHPDEDPPDDRQPQRKTTLMRNHPNERPPNMRPSHWKTPLRDHPPKTLMRDHPKERLPLTDQFRGSIPRTGQTWRGEFLFSAWKLRKPCAIGSPDDQRFSWALWCSGKVMGYFAFRSKTDDLVTPGTECLAWLVDLVKRVSHTHLHLTTHTIFSAG